MNNAHHLGNTGEQAAVAYLQAQGYTIVAQNWRYRRIEVDILAQTSQYLVVVEVKSRRNTLFKDPAQAVNTAKINRLVKAAQAYVLRYGINKEVRFDIIEVVSTANGFAINHIADAFVPPVE
jgi:putative endonuclease